MIRSAEPFCIRLAAVFPQECDSKITVWCVDSDHGDIKQQQGEIIHYPASARRMRLSDAGAAGMISRR
jgi:hypothetical protein